MLQNISDTTETVGTVKRTSNLFNGQAQTFEYSAAQKHEVQPERRGVDPMQNWADINNKKIVAQGDFSTPSAQPEVEDALEDAREVKED